MDDSDKDVLKSYNISKIPDRQTAVALEKGEKSGDIARIAAAGRGKIAEQILQIAFEQGIPVREDADLAQLLAKMELESPVPSEALFAVAEILSYVYRANGEPNPFDAVLESAKSENNE